MIPSGSRPEKIWGMSRESTYSPTPLRQYRVMPGEFVAMSHSATGQSPKGIPAAISLSPLERTSLRPPAAWGLDLPGRKRRVVEKLPGEPGIPWMISILFGPWQAIRSGASSPFRLAIVTWRGSSSEGSSVARRSEGDPASKMTAIRLGPSS